MFERFSQNARQVVVLAQEEARTLDHAYIGSEHLLLGVARNEEGRGAAILVQFGIVAEGVREAVIATVGRGEEPPQGPIPFTRAARAVLDSVVRVGISFGDGIAGSEHLLLALAGWGTGRSRDPRRSRSSGAWASTRRTSRRRSSGPRPTRRSSFAPAAGRSGSSASAGVPCAARNC